MAYFANENGEIVYHGEGAKPADEGLRQVDPPGDTHREKMRHSYDWDSGEFVLPESDNRSLDKKVIDLFRGWAGGGEEAVDLMDQALSPSILIALREGETDMVERRLRKLDRDVLTDSQVDELLELIRA